jgi:Asp-tRNA(Asn)/Glu-tRNA(Gln) amidotransferase A subunit family amidase
MRGYVALGAELRAGRVTPSDYLEECLARTARLDPEIGAFVALAEDASVRAAADSSERWKAGVPLSPVDGMPVAVKDVIETADLPTGQGSPLWTGRQTGRDAATVHALRAAGAVVVGKTTTTEFASVHAYHHTRNPHDLRRTPGGSSSGSAAAVAAGMVPVALGTQVVGSILRPASYCGVVGFKPTLGAINRGGSFDHLSQSCHGVLAATLADGWQALRAIADRVGGDPGCAGLSGDVELGRPSRPTRLAILETGGWARVEKPVRLALEAAARGLRGSGVEVRGRDDDARIERVEAAVADALVDTIAINTWETRWPLAAYAVDGAAGLSADSLGRLERAGAMTEAQYLDALERRTEARRTYAELTAHYDAVITLGASGVAPLGFETTGDPAVNVAASLLGCPALTLPVLEHQGMPLGLQLLGRAGGDAELVAVAAWIAETVYGAAQLVGASP